MLNCKVECKQRNRGNNRVGKWEAKGCWLSCHRLGHLLSGPQLSHTEYMTDLPTTALSLPDGSLDICELSSSGDHGELSGFTPLIRKNL